MEESKVEEGSVDRAQSSQCSTRLWLQKRGKDELGHQLAPPPTPSSSATSLLLEQPWFWEREGNNKSKALKFLKQDLQKG